MVPSCNEIAQRRAADGEHGETRRISCAHADEEVGKRKRSERLELRLVQIVARKVGLKGLGVLPQGRLIKERGLGAIDLHEHRPTSARPLRSAQSEKRRGGATLRA